MHKFDLFRKFLFYFAVFTLFIYLEVCARLRSLPSLSPTKYALSGSVARRSKLAEGLGTGTGAESGDAKASGNVFAYAIFSLRNEYETFLWNKILRFDINQFGEAERKGGTQRRVTKVCEKGNKICNRIIMEQQKRRIFQMHADAMT